MSDDDDINFPEDDYEEDIDPDVELPLEEEIDEGDVDVDTDDEIEETLDDIVDNRIKYYVIHPENRRAQNMLSIMEYANVVGTRATMIDNSIHEHIYVDIAGLTSSLEMAEAEIKANMCPLMIEKIVFEDPYTIKVEIWDVNELIKPV